MKTPYMGFKTSKMDQIPLQYCYNGFIRPLRVDGREFLHRKPTLKKGSPDQKSKHRTCAEACNSYKIKKRYTRGINISLKGGQGWIASVQPFPPLKQNQGLIEGAAENLPNNPRQENGGTQRETPWARACLPITPSVPCCTWFIICTFSKDK